MSHSHSKSKKRRESRKSRISRDIEKRRKHSIEVHIKRLEDFRHSKELEEEQKKKEEAMFQAKRLSRIHNRRKKRSKGSTKRESQTQTSDEEDDDNYMSQKLHKKSTSSYKSHKSTKLSSDLPDLLPSHHHHHHHLSSSHKKISFTPSHHHHHHHHHSNKSFLRGKRSTRDSVATLKRSTDELNEMKLLPHRISVEKTRGFNERTSERLSIVVLMSPISISALDNSYNDDVNSIDIDLDMRNPRALQDEETLLDELKSQNVSEELILKLYENDLMSHYHWADGGRGKYPDPYDPFTSAQVFNCESLDELRTEFIENYKNRPKNYGNRDKIVMKSIIVETEESSETDDEDDDVDFSAKKLPSLSKLRNFRSGDVSNVSSRSTTRAIESRSESSIELEDSHESDYNVRKLSRKRSSYREETKERELSKRSSLSKRKSSVDNNNNVRKKSSLLSNMLTRFIPCYKNKSK